MSRPKKLTLDFFMHDCGARCDRKIASLRRRHGNDGYAAYFILLEMICQEDGMILSLAKPLDAEHVVNECGLRDYPHLTKILETCIELELLDRQMWESERSVFSHGLFKRYKTRLQERKQDAERKKSRREADSLDASIKMLDDSPGGKLNCPDGNDWKSIGQYTNTNTDLKPDPDPEQKTESKLDPIASEDSRTKQSDLDPVKNQRLSAKGKTRLARTKKSSGGALAATSAANPETFEAWWSAYRSMCQTIGASAGEKKAAWTEWLKSHEVYEGQHFRAANQAYFESVLSEFQRRGQAIGVAHGFRYLKSSKWQDAFERVELSKSIGVDLSNPAAVKSAAAEAARKNEWAELRQRLEEEENVAF